MNSENFALECLKKYIGSKPKNDKRLRTIKQAILNISIDRNISRDAATTIFACGFRDALALLALNSHRPELTDQLIDTLPQWMGGKKT